MSGVEQQNPEPGVNTSFGGGTTFGAQTPAASGGLFGTNTSTTTQSTGGLFGGDTSFTGGLGTQATPQATGLFGAAGQSGSVFATPTASAGSTFGAKTPGGFGAAGQQSTGLFGSNTQTASTGLFGGGGSTVATVTPFGSTGGFGATSAIGATGGTTVQFNPPMGNDIMMKGGRSTTISTRHMYITAMKEYETKGFEELRMDDYTAGRKGAQQKAGGLFGSTQTTQSSGELFGATQTTKPAFTGFGAATSTPATGGLFGQTQPQQQQATGLFGGANKTTSLFGATPTTSASTGAFAGFGNQASTSLFGQDNQQKPFVFGATATSQPSGGLFGTTQTSTARFGGFNTTGFGQTSQVNTSILNKPTAFGQPTSSAAAPGFGQASSGGRFSSKPATTEPRFGGPGILQNPLLPTFEHLKIRDDEPSSKLQGEENEKVEGEENEKLTEIEQRLEFAIEEIAQLKEKTAELEKENTGLKEKVHEIGGENLRFRAAQKPETPSKQGIKENVRSWLWKSSALKLNISFNVVKLGVEESHSKSGGSTTMFAQLRIKSVRARRKRRGIPEEEAAAKCQTQKSVSATRKTGMGRQKQMMSYSCLPYQTTRKLQPTRWHRPPSPRYDLWVSISFKEPTNMLANVLQKVLSLGSEPKIAMVENHRQSGEWQGIQGEASVSHHCSGRPFCHSQPAI